MKLGKKNLAAQLYTIREYTKTPKDIAESMKKIKAIGYDAVQISGSAPSTTRSLQAFSTVKGLSAVRHMTPVRCFSIKPTKSLNGFMQ